MRLPSIPTRAVVAAATLVLAGVAQANIVTNGGFETGSFSGWTQFGNTTFNGVQCPGPSPSVHSGNCSAFFGPIGSLGGVSQTLATVAGASYDISFWLEPDGGTPSAFEFNWDGGASELALSNMAASGYVQHTFQLVASSSSTSISFSFRDDPGFIFLDDVVVAASVPEPASLGLAGLALVGLALSRHRRRV